MNTELAFEMLLFAVQSAFVVALLIVLVKFVTIAISNGFNSPYLATPRTYLPDIAEALSIRSGDVVYDLGCGDGRLMLFCAARYQEAQFIGIERNPLLVLYARLRTFMLGNPPNISFRCVDFFKTNFDDATRVYAYLLPAPLNALFSGRPARDSVRLVSRAYTLRDREPTTTIALSKTPGSHGEHLLHVYEL